MKPPESARNDLAAERFSGLYDGLVALCPSNIALELRSLRSTIITRFIAVGSEEAHLAALTSVRLPNWTCRFPASSFHNGEHLLGCKEGMGSNKLPCPPPSQPSLPLQDFSSQPVSWANQVRVFLSGNFPPA